MQPRQFLNRVPRQSQRRRRRLLTNTAELRKERKTYRGDRPSTARADGHLRVTTEPSGAVVRYRGMDLGVTPLDLSLNPDDAPWTLDFFLAGHLPRRARVNPGAEAIDISLARRRVQSPTERAAGARTTRRARLRPTRTSARADETGTDSSDTTSDMQVEPAVPPEPPPAVTTTRRPPGPTTTMRAPRRNRPGTDNLDPWRR